MYVVLQNRILFCFLLIIGRVCSFPVRTTGFKLIFGKIIHKHEELLVCFFLAK